MESSTKSLLSLITPSGPAPAPSKGPRPPKSRYVLMKTVSSAWPLRIVPKGPWKGNAIEIFDTFIGARLALLDKEADATGKIGHRTQRITETNTVAEEYEDWDSDSTTGIVHWYNHQWTLWWVREVHYREW